MDRRFDLAMELLALMVIVDSDTMTPAETEQARDLFMKLEPEGRKLVANDISFSDLLQHLHQKHCG